MDWIIDHWPNLVGATIYVGSFYLALWAHRRVDGRLIEAQREEIGAQEALIAELKRGVAIRDELIALHADVKVITRGEDS